MVVIHSLEEAVDVLRTFPLLLLYVVAGSTIIGGISSVPLIGTFILLISFPAVSGGMYEVFKQASAGDSPTVAAFTEGAEIHFKSLLGAYTFLAFLGVIVTFVFAFLFAAVRLASGPEFFTSQLIGLAVFGAGSGFVFFLFSQFVDVSIVVGNKTAVEGIRHSVRLVLQNPVATLGYTVLRVGATLGLSALVYGLLFGALYTFGHHSLVVFALVVFALSPLILAGHAVVGALSYAYHIEFYSSLTEREEMTAEN